MSKVIILCAGRGRGKTTIVKNIIRKAENAALIFDPNNEYNRPYIPIETFIEQASNVTKTTIIFEEATGFLTTTKNIQKMLEILIRVRHTKNLIVLVYHSINRVPVYIIDNMFQYKHS